MSSFEKVITIRRLHECKWGFRCRRMECPYIHSSRGEQKDDIVGSDIKTIELSFTQVCYNYDTCLNKRCKYAHSVHQLREPRVCKKCLVVNEDCHFMHIDKSCKRYTSHDRLQKKSEIERIFNLKKVLFILIDLYITMYSYSFLCIEDSFT